MNSGWLLMIGSGGFFLFVGLVAIAILLGFKEYGVAELVFLVTLVALALFVVIPGLGWRSTIDWGVRNRQVFERNFPEAKQLLSSNDGKPSHVVIIENGKLVLNEKWPQVYYFTWVDKENRQHRSNIIEKEKEGVIYKLDTVVEQTLAVEKDASDDR